MLQYTQKSYSAGIEYLLTATKEKSKTNSINCKMNRGRKFGNRVHDEISSISASLSSSQNSLVRQGNLKIKASDRPNGPSRSSRFVDNQEAGKKMNASAEIRSECSSYSRCHSVSSTIDQVRFFVPFNTERHAPDTIRPIRAY